MMRAQIHDARSLSKIAPAAVTGSIDTGSGSGNVAMLAIRQMAG